MKATAPYKIFSLHGIDFKLRTWERLFRVPMRGIHGDFWAVVAGADADEARAEAKGSARLYYHEQVDETTRRITRTTRAFMGPDSRSVSRLVLFVPVYL